MVKKLHVFVFIFYILTCLNTIAQQAILSAGENASGSAGKISYSVGQTVYTVNVSATGTFIHGVQQPYEIFVFSDENLHCIEFKCLFYPNPVSKFLILVIESEFINITASLYDTEGKPVKNIIIKESETFIDVSNFSPGTYILKVSDSKEIIKTFKILKTR